jgi:hypothetical protein
VEGVINCFQPGQSIISIGGGVEYYSPRGLGGGAAWWLSGGIAAGNCIAAYQPKGAADLATSYVNLANPGTYDASTGVAPTFNSATGWTFDGSTQWLTTGITAGDTYSMIISFNNCTGDNRFVGAFQGDWVRRFDMGLRFGSTSHSYQTGGSFVSLAPALTSGISALTPTQGYLNGLADGTAYTAGFVDGVIQLGQLGVSVAWFAGNILAFAVYNINIGAYMADLYTAIAAL